MKFLVVLIFILIPALAFTQEINPDEPRADFIKAGGDLLEQKLTAENFLKAAKKIQSERPFNAEEFSFLADLRKKMTPEMDRTICSGHAGLQCEPLQAAAPKEKLFQVTDDEHQRVPNIPEPDVGEHWNRPYLWTAVGVIGLVVVAGFLRNKDVQISFH